MSSLDCCFAAEHPGPTGCQYCVSLLPASKMMGNCFYTVENPHETLQLPRSAPRPGRIRDTCLFERSLIGIRASVVMHFICPYCPSPGISPAVNASHRENHRPCACQSPVQQAGRCAPFSGPEPDLCVSVGAQWPNRCAPGSAQGFSSGECQASCRLDLMRLSLL